MEVLSANCLRSVATCLGGCYHTGQFRATCSRVRIATPAAPFKSDKALQVIRHCCREGDVLTIIQHFSNYMGIFLSDALNWAGRYRHVEMVPRLLARFRPAHPIYFLKGTARSGDTDQFHQALEMFREYTDKGYGTHIKNFFSCLEYEAGRSGNISMCEEVLKVTKSVDLKHFLTGAARSGRASLCETLISRGATCFSDMVLYATFKDSVEVFDMAAKHLGLDLCLQICNPVLKSKLIKHIAELK